MVQTTLLETCCDRLRRDCRGSGITMMKMCVLLAATLLANAPGHAGAFMGAPLVGRSAGLMSRRVAALQPTAPRRRAVGSGLLALRSQQQTQEEEKTATLLRDGAPFPPPWLFPFLVPATGGALFGYDIGATSSVTRILGENAGALGQLGGEKSSVCSATVHNACIFPLFMIYSVCIYCCL